MASHEHNLRPVASRLAAQAASSSRPLECLGCAVGVGTGHQGTGRANTVQKPETANNSTRHTVSATGTSTSITVASVYAKSKANKRKPHQIASRDDEPPTAIPHENSPENDEASIRALYMAPAPLLIVPTQQNFYPDKKGAFAVISEAPTQHSCITLHMLACLALGRMLVL